MKTLFHIHIFILISLSWGQQDLPCPKGSSCTPRGSCVSYKSKIQQLRTLTKGTNEYRLEFNKTRIIHDNNILEYSWVSWRDWSVTKVKEKFAVKKRHQHTPQQTPPAPCIYLVPRKQNVAFQEMLNSLLVGTGISHLFLNMKWLNKRWRRHKAWRVPLDGAAQEAEGKWQGLVALWR